MGILLLNILTNYSQGMLKGCDAGNRQQKTGGGGGCLDVWLCNQPVTLQPAHSPSLPRAPLSVTYSIPLLWMCLFSIPVPHCRPFNPPHPLPHPPLPSSPPLFSPLQPSPQWWTARIRACPRRSWQAGPAFITSSRTYLSSAWM